MKVGGRVSSAFVVFGCLETLKKHEALLFSGFQCLLNPTRNISIISILFLFFSNSVSPIVFFTSHNAKTQYITQDTPTKGQKLSWKQVIFRYREPYRHRTKNIYTRFVLKLISISVYFHF